MSASGGTTSLAWMPSQTTLASCLCPDTSLCEELTTTWDSAPHFGHSDNRSLGLRRQGLPLATRRRNRERKEDKLTSERNGLGSHAMLVSSGPGQRLAIFILQMTASQNWSPVFPGLSWPPSMIRPPFSLVTGVTYPGSTPALSYNTKMHVIPSGVLGQGMHRAVRAGRTDQKANE